MNEPKEMKLGYWCICCEKVHPFSNKRHLCYIPIYGTSVYTKKGTAWILEKKEVSA